MNISKKIVKKIIIVLFIITVSISFANRTIYGTWNIFSYPDKLYFDVYRYNIGQIVILKDNEKPQYDVSRKIDRLTGKRIYSKEKNFIGYGKVVYLYLDNDKYLTFTSGGG